MFKVGSGALKDLSRAGREATSAREFTSVDEVINDVGGTADSSNSSNLEATLCGVGANSFSANTLVETEAQGQEQAISTLKVGDHVLAYNEQSGTTGIFTITAVLVHNDPTLVDLTIDGEKIETTPEHPFYTREYGWLGAGYLWQGAHIRKSDGSFGTVEAVKVVERQQVMYNLTVEGAHTFFVGDKHWLVHNANGDCAIGQLDTKLYGESELSKAVAEHRLTLNNPFTGKNFAAFKLDDGTIIVAGSGSFHSEKELGMILEKQGISFDKVVAAYSEREPCAYAGCARFLGDTNKFTNLNGNVTYHVPYWTEEERYFSKRNRTVEKLIRNYAAKVGS